MEIPKKILKLLDDNPYWNDGHIVYGNFGDTDTFTYCIARNKIEGRDIARGLNILWSINSDTLKLKEIA
jgi:hypothetical protein